MNQIESSILALNEKLKGVPFDLHCTQLEIDAEAWQAERSLLSRRERRNNPGAVETEWQLRTDERFTCPTSANF